MIIATLERGGAEKQLVMLVAHLDRTRFEPSVVALTRGGPYERLLKDHGIPCDVVGKKAPLSPVALMRLVSLLRRRKPDVVHTWMFTSNAYGRVAARLAGVRRIIAGERGVDLWKGPIRLALDRILAPITDCVVANSKSVFDWLCSKGIPRSLIETIPNALDPADYPAKSMDSVGGVGLAPRLIAVGHLRPDKRYDVVLRAMGLILRDFPRAQLTIAGKGALRPRLEALASDLGVVGNVSMPGFVEGVPRLLFESDLFLTASAYEGLPNAVMEAMYAGVPVVATDAPGTVDLVRHAVTGVLVPGGDHEALAQAAVSLLRDSERMQGLAERARRTIVENYSVERMVSAYEQLYSRMAGLGG